MISGSTIWSSGFGHLEPLRIEARGVGGVGVAAAAVVGLGRLVVGREHDRFQLHVVGAEKVGEVEFGRRSLLDADRGAVELERRIDPELLAHHEALPVVIIDAGEEHAAGLARQRPGGVADEHVDLARGQDRRPVLGVDRQELDLRRIVEDRRGDRAALVDVEALVDALIVGQAEAGEARIGAADQLAARLDLIERARVGGKSGRGAESRSGEPGNKRSHDNLLIDAEKIRPLAGAAGTHVVIVGSAGR